MSVTSSGLALRQIGSLFQHGVAAHQGDRALLDRFLERRDEAAFEALLARHGPMVLGVCRRLLNDPRDVDDSFQATFLVLVQKAGRLRDADRLGPWLYGVALRVATRARVRTARLQARQEVLSVEPEVRDCGDPAEWRDLHRVLDDELRRLSDKHRDVLVLCLLEGLSPDEAADRLRCPTGTVKSRLARARETLKARLSSRGIAPAVVAATLEGSRNSATASLVSEPLIQSTLRILAAPVGSAAPGVVALARGVTLSMFWKPIKLATLGLAGVVATGFATLVLMKSDALGQDPGPGGAQNAGARGPAVREIVDVGNNFKQILLAVHNYNDTHNGLPAYALYGSDGRPKLSWRVALLPYLEQEALYKQFHFEEDWDSPHNMALVAKMPRVFATPGESAASGQTRIRGFLGKGAAFEGVKGLEFRDFTDGTSNTAMIALAKESVPWTKPEGLAVGGWIASTLDDRDGEGYPLGMLDGSYRLLPKRTPDLSRVLAALVSRNGGEVIQDPNVPQNPTGGPAIATPRVLSDEPPMAFPPNPSGGPAIATGPARGGPTPGIGPAGGGAMTPPMGAAALGAPGLRSPADLERRLDAIERKLDLLLQRTGGLGGARSDAPNRQ